MIVPSTDAREGVVSLPRIGQLAVVICIALAAHVSFGQEFTPTQLTHSRDCVNDVFYANVTDATGSHVVFVSDCDLTGGNADRSFEVFRYDTDADAATQITDSVDCNSGAGDRFFSSAISGDGTRIVFQSECNLTGDNADGNVEVFLFDSETNVMLQLTDTTDCLSGPPVIDHDGSHVAFPSDCQFFASRDDSYFGIYVLDVNLSVTTRVVYGERCGLGPATISGDGRFVVYSADCDVTGDNADRTHEVFLFDAATNTTEQITDSRDCINDRAVSDFVAISADGSRMAYNSSCDLADAPPAFAQTYVFDIATRSPTQVVTATNCAPRYPSISGNGNQVFFSADCDPTGENADRSSENFRFDVANEVLTQITSNTSCEQYYPVPTNDGDRVVYTSTCDPDGGNGDHNFEIFLASSGGGGGGGGGGCRIGQASYSLIWLLHATLITLAVRRGRHNSRTAA